MSSLNQILLSLLRVGPRTINKSRLLITRYLLWTARQLQQCLATLLQRLERDLAFFANLRFGQSGLVLQWLCVVEGYFFYVGRCVFIFLSLFQPQHRWSRGKHMRSRTNTVRGLLRLFRIRWVINLALWPRSIWHKFICDAGYVFQGRPTLNPFLRRIGSLSRKFVNVVDVLRYVIWSTCKLCHPRSYYCLLSI